MLRAIVVVLMLANLGFLAWHQGWLNDWLGQLRPAASQREPQRLQMQINPERLIVLPPAPPAASDAASAEGSRAPGSSSLPLAAVMSLSPAVGGVCYQAGPFTSEEHRRVQAALSQQLTNGSWVTETVVAPGLWLVYMGPYPDPETLARKQTELRRIRNLNFEEVRSPPSLAMGLSLGRFNQQSQADATLETLRQRGVRTARIVTIRPAADLMVIRIPQATADVQRLLPALPLPSGKGFVTCSA